MNRTDLQIKIALEAYRLYLQRCYSHTNAAPSENNPIRSYGDDPCQAYRDALEIQRGASALLQAAYMDSEQIVTQLEMDLATCEGGGT